MRDKIELGITPLLEKSDQEITGKFNIRILKNEVNRYFKFLKHRFPKAIDHEIDFIVEQSNNPKLFYSVFVEFDLDNSQSKRYANFIKENLSKTWDDKSIHILVIK